MINFVGLLLGQTDFSGPETDRKLSIGVVNNTVSGVMSGFPISAWFPFSIGPI